MRVWTIRHRKVQIWMLRKAVRFRERVGTWCGDGVVQQAGLIGGGILESESDYARDSGAWEGCDPGSEDSPVAAVQSLAPSLGTGTAHCQSSCIGYDLVKTKPWSMCQLVRL